MVSALDALNRLKDGNFRFVAGVRDNSITVDQARRSELVAAQAPFATVLGCSDSRVPVELVFDQGLGDLFVVRVAGNIATPSQIGSIEFAVQQLGTRLVVVLGHTRCWAVAATVAALGRSAPELSPDLLTIVDHIRPAVEPLLEAERRSAPDSLARSAVRANIRAAVQDLREGLRHLTERDPDDGLLVVGAEYSLETGAVEFFDGLPPAD